MATGKTHISAALLALLAAVALVVGVTSRPVHHVASAGAFPIGDDDGRDAVQPDSKRPKIEATFTRESYKAGDLARLDLWSSARGVSVRIWRAGTQQDKIVANDLMDGNPVSQPVRLGAVPDGRTVRLRIGDWPSGLYFARLDGDGGKLGFAPFVLAPTRLGEHRVAVVQPTMTWQAYNFRDEDHDGKGDTWYANWKHLQAHLFRPYLNRGVPNHYKAYDDPFLRWLHATHREVDQLSDGDLNALGSAAALRKAYDLIVFPGHHEYVTTHEYDLIQRYRDLGGNLMFLSANNFFWRVDRRGNTITRVAKWRDLGRPEAALIGVQYIGNDDGSHRGPWLVRTSSAPASWVFRGTEIRAGDGFGNGGIEADATGPASPRNVRVLAEIPDLFAPGFTAQMSYYVGPRGSQVFAAGAFTLAGAIWDEQVQQIVTNVWERLSGTV